jgi:hypothetical protein
MTRPLVDQDTLTARKSLGAVKDYLRTMNLSEEERWQERIHHATRRMLKFCGPFDVSDPEAHWLWEGRTNSNGRGMLTVYFPLSGYATKVRASRLSWYLFVGPLPGGLKGGWDSGMRAANTCGHVGCIRPSHLKLAPLEFPKKIIDLDELARKQAKREEERGKAREVRKALSRMHLAKAAVIKREKLKQRAMHIINMRAAGIPEEHIARQTSVSLSTVQRITNGKVFCELPRPLPYPAVVPKPLFELPKNLEEKGKHLAVLRRREYERKLERMGKRPKEIRSGHTPNRTEFYEGIAVRISQMRKAGSTMQAIANELGCAVKTVRSVCLGRVYGGKYKASPHSEE